MLYTLSLVVILVAAPIVFIALYFITAPYGRHFREGWGPSMPARFGWMVMEAPALIVMAVTVLSRASSVSPLAFALLALWEIHYGYRTLVFPFLIREQRTRMPIVLAAMAFLFNCMNGYANGSWLAGFPQAGEGGVVFVVRVAVGAALFACGFVTHVLSDRTLRSLRRNGEGGYQIPHGGLFEYVSSPNYFGEILEWCGWAIATWSLPGLAFALFTVGNLVPRAHANRRWYKATFPEYPAQRRRVIPFVY